VKVGRKGTIPGESRGEKVEEVARKGKVGNRGWRFERLGEREEGEGKNGEQFEEKILRSEFWGV
jgi:hypothetical protein